jgi:hypothetical protein
MAGILFPCSFDMSPRFVVRTRPERPRKAFLAGRPGILTPSLEKRYKLIAWRYLSGLPLNSAEQKAFVPVKSGNRGNGATGLWEQWRAARNAVDGTDPADSSAFFTGFRQSRISPETWYENCLNDAIATATTTLVDRRARYAGSALLRDWVQAQDTVFSHCSQDATLWPPNPETSMPALAQADRRYQIAAAHFYGEDLDEAEKLFREISENPDSPWRAMGAYMMGRTLIRQYSLLEREESLVKAEQELVNALKEPAFSGMYPDMTTLLELTRSLLNPQTAIDRLTRLLSLPHPGAAIAKTIDEAAWVTSVERFQAALAESAAPGFEWVKALEAEDGALPLRRWREKHSEAPGSFWRS